MGIISGTTMFLSLLNQPNWLTVSMINHSIHYEATQVYNDYLPLYISTTVYMLMILLPLMISSDRYLRILGTIILISMIVSQFFFSLTFISVWCYLAALISLYIYYIVTRKVKEAEPEIQTTLIP